MVTDSEPVPKVAENLIEIRVNDIAQLFHTLDPFPFREKDLAAEAEDYICRVGTRDARQPPLQDCGARSG